MLQGRINDELTGDNITVDRIVRASSARRFSGRRGCQAPRASRFQLGDNWPVLVFVGLLAILIGLKGRFTGFDAHSLSVNAMPLDADRAWSIPGGADPRRRSVARAGGKRRRSGDGANRDGRILFLALPSRR